MSRPAPRTAAVIASAGRPDVLTFVLDHLLEEVAGLDLVVVCVPDERSLPARDGGERLLLLTGPRGASAQRNHAVEHLPASVDHVFFFDDDCLPDRRYVTEGVTHFDEHPACVGLTGRLVYDGAKQGAVDPAAGARLLLESPGQPSERAVRSTYGLYGCNFAVRRSAVPTEWFDARLPLYSWLEDEDLSRRLARRGELHSVDRCACVHLGSASGGRTSHLRFGYSQVVNPVYLWRKGSITLRRTIVLIAIPVVGNLRGLLGKDRGSRVARLRGDLLAAGDLLRGRTTPERITTLHEERT